MLPTGALSEPCPACGVAAPLAARECPGCRSRLLVDVFLESAPRDPRSLYRAARLLSGLGPPLADFAGLQRALVGVRPCIARGVTRAVGLRVREALAAADLLGDEQPAVAPRRRLPMAVGGAFAILALLVGIKQFRASRPIEEAMPEPPPAAAPAGPRAATGGSPRPWTRRLVAKGDAARTLLAGVVERSMPAIVSLRCTEWVGAGFYVSEDVILTNAHVLCREGGRVDVVSRDGSHIEGSAVLADEALDFGVVRVPARGRPALPLGDAGTLAVDDPVVMVGSPFGREFTSTPGAVSDFTGILGTSYIQVNADVNPGNSGGPLLNHHGQVVGIVSLKHKSKPGIGWALPINYAYERASTFFTGPANADSSGFRDLVAKAEQINFEGTAELGQAFARPALVRLIRSGPESYAILVRLGLSVPAPEEVVFRALDGDQEVCRLKTPVLQWQLTDLQLTNDARVESWLRRYGLDKKVYVGKAPLLFGQCGMVQMLELELEGAPPGLSRVDLNSGAPVAPGASRRSAAVR